MYIIAFKHKTKIYGVEEVFLLFATLFGISFVLFIVLIGEIQIEIFFPPALSDRINVNSLKVGKKIK